MVKALKTWSIQYSGALTVDACSCRILCKVAERQNARAVVYSDMATRHADKPTAFFSVNIRQTGVLGQDEVSASAMVRPDAENLVDPWDACKGFQDYIQRLFYIRVFRSSRS
jgi:hypothetical protein